MNASFFVACMVLSSLLAEIQRLLGSSSDSENVNAFTVAEALSVQDPFTFYEGCCVDALSLVLELLNCEASLAHTIVANQPFGVMVRMLFQFVLQPPRCPQALKRLPLHSPLPKSIPCLRTKLTDAVDFFGLDVQVERVWCPRVNKLLV